MTKTIDCKPSSAADSMERDSYSREKAMEFGWSSMTGSLNEARVALLERAICGKTVLDAGCGGGAYVNLLSGKGYDVTGVDIHDMFLDVSSERGFAGKYIQGDIVAGLPFPDKAFDTTYCFDVLEHVDDVAAISELVRVTKYRLIVGVPQKDERANKYLLTYYPYLDLTHRRYYTVESLHALLSSVGPSSVEIEKSDRVPVEWLVVNEVKAVSRWPLLTPIYRGLFSFLASRAKGPDWYVTLNGIATLEGL